MGLKGKPWPTIRGAVLQAITTGFSVFPTTADKVIRAGRWSPGQARATGIEYLQAHAAQVYDLLQTLQTVQSNSPYLFRRYESEDKFVFCRDMVEAAQSSEAWVQFLRDLAANAGRKQSDAEQRWEDVEIRFLSDFKVQAVVKGKVQEPQDYADIGFGDGRHGKPRAAWDTLRALAQSGGVISSTPTAKDWAKLEKRMQEIRKLLKAWFHIDVDPVPYVDGGYRARLKIVLSASYEL